MAPGKFEGNLKPEIAEELYMMSLDGVDDEEGSSAYGGWHGLLLSTGISDAPNAIVYEDSQGFVEYEPFDTQEQALAAWDDLVDDQGTDG